MAVVLPRNMLEKDKGKDLKFRTNPRNSVRKSDMGFPTLITLLVFLLWFMGPCTRVNHFAVFQQSETCMLKPLQISECMQFLPPQSSLSFCVISVLESLMLTLSWKGLPAFLWFVLSVLSVLHRFGRCILSVLILGWRSRGFWKKCSTTVSEIFHFQALKLDFH